MAPSSNRRTTSIFSCAFNKKANAVSVLVTATEPPTGLTHALAGVWWDAKGDWTRAHESAQQDEGRDGSWVHAYLHRKEADQGNATYWYNRAGKAVCGEPLDAEWLSIVTALIKAT
jgi:hypothetical protein